MKLLLCLVSFGALALGQINVDSSGNATANSFKAGENCPGCAAVVDLPAGTAPASFPPNTFSIVAPVTIPLSFHWTPPSSQSPGAYVYIDPSGQMSYSTPSGGGGGGSSSGVPPWESTPVTPPALANWSQINPTSNGIFADVQGGVLINSPSGDNTKQLYMAAPSGAFTLTAHISASCPAGGNWPATAIFVADPGDARVVDWELTNHAGIRGVRSVYWASSASGGNSVPFGDVALGAGDFWQRLQYTGAQFLLQLSPTGTAGTWWTAATFNSSAWLTGAPARVGFLAYAQLTGMNCIAVLGSWQVTQP